MKKIGYCILNDVNLCVFNSMRINSNAENLYLPYTTEGLEEICRQFTSGEEMLIVGKGSNTIFSRNNYTIPVVCTDMLCAIDETNQSFIVQSGVELNKLAWYAQEKGVSGYEFLEDIPGSVGGALFMNAGTYNDTISQLVETVKIYDFTSRKVRETGAAELKKHWGKRKSYFQQADCFIIECRLKADTFGDRTEILDKMLEIKKVRYAKQPREYPSAGSVFKRPNIEGKDLYVWKLLDEAGLRGYSIGGAMVSEKHPGFIVNRGNGTGQDFVKLLDFCKLTVKEKFGIDLEEEWRIV